MLLLVPNLAGCHAIFDGVFPYVCEARDDPGLERLPDELSLTGLYADMENEQLSPGVLAYQPRFELWSDGATKRRWMWLPPGSVIDTRDPDDWKFPSGTRAWKEFSRDGVRVETRLIAKIGAASDPWLAQSYLWDDEGAATAAPMGYVDARGTQHDVPAALECDGCHAGRDSYLLGISALQLAGGLLPAEQFFSDPVPEPPPLPGDDDAQRALGYLHANCGHCHSSGAPEDRPCFGPDNTYDFWLTLDSLGSVEDTPTYASAVGAAITPGDAAGSLLVQRISTRDLFTRMPPFGTRQTDEDAIDLVRRWIDGMQ